ncbi:adenylyl-sulfate kinase [Amycolatopsis cihanbeyliensis]|uniref:Adenylyl-sulfate kinase n=1 Tax=Amycolatopsis cihanbeyliensis TaxID=1128664 RepID=A0A542DQH4_AMYCI|nr:adenylyl-sulfate kinase [Amycolatopsis cihanbeyliensis]TQJ05307.1 adenylylsulfate kinase /sulfate adenylyltransferase subunit 1 [Amycolatopsis cihanbeyliensis]
MTRPNTLPPGRNPEDRADLLRFLTCGSVDDGKSTLIGRLLYESGLLHTDQLDTLAADSRRHGTRGAEPDFALLVDGLAAEREQGITIDVAYRFFTTERRRFIVADTPGHEQYTRNMVTGASTADAAVILLDARKGLLSQTYRHTNLVALLGIRQIVLAVNKLDLVGYSREVFERISAEYRAFAAELGITEVACIPISAVEGTNVVTRSVRTPWYEGQSLLEWLESAEAHDGSPAGPAHLLVQWVNRPDGSFRGFSGRVLGGTLRQGDRVRVRPGEQESVVERIVTMDGELAEAVGGSAVTVVLADELDVSRGSVLAVGTGVEAADAFQAHLVWLDEHEMLPGRRYLAKFGARTVGFTAERPKHRIDVRTQAKEAARTLRSGEICVVNVRIDEPVAYQPYRLDRDLGSFIVLDRVSNRTVGAGMIDFALRRSANVRWQAVTVDKRARTTRNGHRPCVVWFTGLSGAGKSTIADLVERRLHGLGAHTFLLDGDNVRHGLNSDLGFTEADRVENIRRIAEVAALMVQAGLIVLVSFISPFGAERALARGLVEAGEFCEVYVDTPLETAERRDPKGLYARARRGELVNFTGIDSPYEPPAEPELRLDTTRSSPEQAAEEVLGTLRGLGVLDTY